MDKIQFGTKKHRLEISFHEKHIGVFAWGKFVTGEMTLYSQFCEIDDIKKIYSVIKDPDSINAEETPSMKACLTIKGKYRGMGYCDEINIYKKLNGQIVFSVYCGYHYYSHDFILSNRQLLKLAKAIKKFYKLGN